jgi:dGTPase
MYKNKSLLEKLAVYVSLLKDLFHMYKKDPKKLPEEWYAKIDSQGAEEVILDYIAGMTDVYAIKQYYNLV